MNSFLQGKKTLTIPPLRPVVGPPRPAIAPAGASSARPAAPVNCGGASPSVEVVKEGDKVVRLVVVCGCGERVEIECLYPGGG
ncbi:MAG TPA: hypothetical protein VEA63_05380 [Opitutus sp.]|jgi:hypothetical protein|nr:hypothetical protein [Opitutus sp.]